jgi:tRNA pseudouridine55 synthase
LKNQIQNKYHGWLILNKPYGISSNAALQKIRYVFNKAKAGHVGTLDPLATGVLPIALGEATKLIPFLEKSRKIYDFEVTWGERRATDDLEGEVIAVSEKRPTLSEIEASLIHFIGEIEQFPPLYSAVKIEGRAAYRYARQNQTISLKARKVFVEELQVTRISSEDKANFRVACGSGVYVRSLARDLAIFLGTEGYVSSLHRVQVGSFKDSQSISLQKILEMQAYSELQRMVHSMDVVLDDIPVVVFGEDICDRFRKGQSLVFHLPTLPASIDSVVLCKSASGVLCGILSYKDGLLAPKRIFNHLNIRR